MDTRSLPSCLVVAGAVAGTWWAGPPRADAYPPYLTAWQAKYPTGTTSLVARMQSTLGSNCFVCHSPSGDRADPITCYKRDLSLRLDAGRTIAQALDDVHAIDSDGDGVPNGEEIVSPRNDGTGAIGFHPGLKGPSGTDPCGADPARPVTGVAETRCRADFDGAGGATIADVFAFLNAWFAGSFAADFDDSQDITIDDIFQYLNAWFAGCS